MIVGEEEIPIKPLYLILMKNQLGNVKECKTFIRHGCVKVNGEVCTDVQCMVSRDDCIECHDKWVDANIYAYYMLNKPKGYISASFDKHDPCVVDLIDRKDCHCVGRLDRETTGFLLLTNDESLSKTLLLPSCHCDKKYLVTTKNPIHQDMVVKFQQGVVIDKDVLCKPACLEIIDDYHCYVTLQEGKYHQVKKMFLSCDNQVIALKRVMFAGLTLDSQLKEGSYRLLNNEEINILLSRRK